jgi:hypothetical protein
MVVTQTDDPAESALARRFPELPQHCYNDVAPGTDEVEEWRDWSGIETTPDQRRIEDFVSRYDLRGAALLHIGVGNSGLALRFADRAETIVGTTISPAELRHGTGLGIGNYRVALNNKYGGVPVPGPDRFDFIIDNNPTTFGCCRGHFHKMMAEYRRRLKDSGMIVTDCAGLGWLVSTEGANPRWKFDYDDWAFLGHAYGLRPECVDDTLYVLAGRSAVVRRPIAPRRSFRTAARRLSRVLRARI